MYKDSVKHIIKSLNDTIEVKIEQAEIRDSFKNVLDEFCSYFGELTGFENKLIEIKCRINTICSNEELKEITLGLSKTLVNQNSTLKIFYLKSWFNRINGLEKDPIDIRTLSREEKKHILPVKAFEIDARFNDEIESGSGKYLFDQLSSYIAAYRETRDKYYAPYTAIIQSSGFGKTKQFESLSKRCFVIYVSLSSANSTSFPHRSGIADFLLDSSIETLEEVEARFHAYFSVYMDYLMDEKLADSPRIFKNCVDSGSSENGKLVDEIKQFYKRQIDKKTRCVMKRLQSNVKTIFVFDEARNLINTKFNFKVNSEKIIENYFIILRRTLKSLPNQCFAVFTDTLSYLSNFIPVSDVDPSSRVSQNEFELFDPIYSIPTWDIFANMDKLTPEKLDSMENILSYGRPLWYAFYKGIIELKDENFGPDYIANFARTKLLCNQILKSANEISVELALALIGCRAQIDVDPKSNEASILVANYMRICLYIDDSRSNIYTAYSSEPILAEGSALICNQKGYYEQVLSKIQNAVTNGVVSQGKIGELTARIILLMANDRCPLNELESFSMMFTRKVSLKTYLKCIIGLEKLESIQNNYKAYGLSEKKIDQLLNAVMFFNHFVQFEKNPTFQELQKLLKRCGACICSPNQKYLDLIIPILFDSSDFNSLGFVLIQIKNYKDPVLPKKVEFMNPFSLKLVNEIFLEDEKNLPFLSLYIELGGSSESTRVMDKTELNLDFKFTKKKGLTEEQYEELKLFVKHNQFFIYLNGIGKNCYNFLSESELIELRKLCQAKNEIKRKLEENHTEFKVYEKIAYLGFINH